MPIQKGVSLLYEKWIFVYGINNYSMADKIYNQMGEASGDLMMKVQEPYWIEMQREDNF